MQPGDLIKVVNPKISRMLQGQDPGLGIIISVTENMVKVKFFSEGPWRGEIKPLAKVWVEVINESG